MIRWGIQIIFFFLSVSGLFISCSEDDTSKESLVSEYNLDNEIFKINTPMYWESGGGVAEKQIRLMEPLPASILFDMIILSPVSGPSSLEGTYLFSQTGDIGTYNLVFIHATDGEDDFQWFTNGTSGNKLEITKEGMQNGLDIYRLTIADFTLNYGFWDYLAGKWVSLGEKQFRLSYEGPIVTP